MRQHFLALARTLAGVSSAFVADARADELPSSIRLDRYLLDIAEQEKWENWERACDLYARIEQERLPTPPDFDLRYANALFHARRNQAAKDRLTGWVKRADRTTDAYDRGLQLLVDVERRITKEAEDAAREESRRLEDEAAKAKADRERAEQRAKDMLRRGQFLEEQVRSASSYLNYGFIAAGGGLVVVGVTALVLNTGVRDLGGSFLLTGVAGLVGAALVGVGSLCAPDWTSPGTPIGVVVGTVVVPGVILTLASLASRSGSTFFTSLAMSIAAVGGGVIAAGLGFELAQRRRADDAWKALQAHQAELRARPITPPAPESSRFPLTFEAELVSLSF